MKQPFEPKQLRRYLMIYGSVLVLMLLFYLLSKTIHTPQTHLRKSFEGNVTQQRPDTVTTPSKSHASPFRLMPKAE